MTWLLPSRRLVAALKRAAKVRGADRHRIGYFRDYYLRNRDRLRPYHAAKKREYKKDKQCSPN